MNILHLIFLTITIAFISYNDNKASVDNYNNDEDHYYLNHCFFTE